MRSPSSRAGLILVALLLLLQFGLRARAITALPAFVDEHSHITRARVAYAFDYNPTLTSHGKLLLYYWIGLFDPRADGDVGLMLSRLSIALFSLLSGAAAAAIARDLFGRGAMLPALAFYVLLPFALFFDRMALADSFAGALAALAVWSSVRLARRPTVGRGAVAGVLLALASLAKLTTALLVALPLITVLLLDDGPRAESWRDAIRRLWRRYGGAWRAAALSFLEVWSVVLALALASVLAGNEPILLDRHLVDEATSVASLADKLDDFGERLEYLISIPMTLILAGLVLLALGRRPRAIGVPLAWLLLLWGPLIVIAVVIQSRYLMVGSPALAVLFGGGVAVAGETLAGRWRWATARTLTALLALGLLGGWALGFALPFAANAISDPAALRLPDRDYYDYYRNVFNTWGIRQSLDYLRAHGERNDGQIHAIGVVVHCSTLRLHMTPDFDWDCVDRWDFPSQRVQADPNRWPLVGEAAARWPVVYVISEYPQHLPLDAPPVGGPLRWSLEFTFARPHGGQMVAVWRVSAVQEGADS
ncbi:MAG: hypothetical protein GXY36_04940 [Chloroflexi bacterium]|nr:hypothetical protein [Chloroflexota bacterium]